MTGSFGSAAPVGVDEEEPIELGTTKKISKVTKDWSDPPSVTPTLTPEVSGSSLKAVLVELQKLTEWGTGGGTLEGTGTGGELQAEPSDDGKSYTVALKGKFVLTLVKWKEYDTMTARAEEGVGRHDRAFDGTRTGTRRDFLPRRRKTDQDAHESGRHARPAEGRRRQYGDSSRSRRFRFGREDRSRQKRLDDFQESRSRHIRRSAAAATAAAAKALITPLFSPP